MTPATPQSSNAPCCIALNPRADPFAQYQQGGNQGYGSYNPYDQSANPYNDTQGYSDQPSYGGRNQGNQYPDEEQQGGYGKYHVPLDHQHPLIRKSEMRNVNGADPNRILNETRAVDQAIDEIEADLQRLRGLQSRYLADTNTSAQSPLRIEVDRTGDNIMTKYRGLVTRVKNIKSQPESGNPRNAPQVGKVDRRLKTAINQYQQVEREFRKASQEQMARQYRIVRPDASDAEVREAVEDPNNQQIFSSALIQSDRRGEAQSVARNVSQRHEDIQKIERQMIELAQLFQDLEALVVQQEPAVTQIEQRGEEVTEHVAKANTELGGAVDKARAARRKKWWCLGIARKLNSPATAGTVLMDRQSSLSSSLWLLWWWWSKSPNPVPIDLVSCVRLKAMSTDMGIQKSALRIHVTFQSTACLSPLVRTVVPPHAHASRMRVHASSSYHLTIPPHSF